mmetsp:Transcript_19046/g.62087  ORF Transcript_19046/g.62087 Transcript_19046/m.62087 type:complete len:358 (+) Transcript_19046:1-1074(+)
MSSRPSVSRARPRATRLSRSIARVSAGAEPANASSSGRRPLRVVITGGSKGLGKAIVEQFAAGGDAVLTCGRSEEALRSAHGESGSGGVRWVHGIDVGSANCMARLSDAAQEELGGVDVWINNAGTNCYTFETLQTTDPAVLEEVVRTNLLGTIFASRVAIDLMAKQAEGGHVFCMEGAGSDGNPTRKYAAYGFTKAGMGQLSKSLSDECRQEEGGPPITVSTLSPGIVYTELISCGDATFGKWGRWVINSIAEEADVVAGALVPRIREYVANPANERSAGRIAYLTPALALEKLMRRLLKGENKDRFAPEDRDGELGRMRLEWTPALESAFDKLLIAGHQSSLLLASFLAAFTRAE